MSAAAPPAEPAPAAAPPPDPRVAERRAKRAETWAQTKGDLKWAAALLLVLVLTGPIVAHYLGQALPFLSNVNDPWPAWSGAPEGEENLGNVSDAFFSTGDYANGTKPATLAGQPPQPGLVAPFEILSVLLLAALIAGVVIALRDREGDA